MANISKAVFPKISQKTGRPKILSGDFPGRIIEDRRSNSFKPRFYAVSRQPGRRSEVF
jgi:hypothetical protein